MSPALLSDTLLHPWRTWDLRENLPQDETVRGNTRLHFLAPELERRLSYMGTFLYEVFLRKRNTLCYFSLHEINLY